MSDVEMLDDTNSTKKCYKLKEDLNTNLNIAYDEKNRKIAVWNKFRIFLYEDFDFDNRPRIIHPEYPIKQLVAINNHLIVVDRNGNLHIISMNLKDTDQKVIKSYFSPVEQNVLCCLKYTEQSALSLTLENGTYFLCFHQIDTKFKCGIKLPLICGNDDWPVTCSDKKQIVAHKSVSEQNFDYLKKLLNLESIFNDHSIILISCDKLSVYACLASRKSTEDVVPLTKLYTSPVEISDILIHDKDSLNVVIALKTGTLVLLPLNKFKKSEEITTIHLNTAVERILEFKNSLIYTNGRTLWRTELGDTFSKDDMKYSQFFVKDVKDFIKTGDQLICMTYLNLIYIFQIENADSYLKCEKGYYRAEKLLNNSEYLHRITEEIEKNKNVVAKIEKERSYLTALSLSKRQDIMDTVIQQKVTVFESYEEVNGVPEITLTEELKEYFEPETLLFLITITTSVQHSLSNILSKLVGDMEIHISLISKGKFLKTTSLKVKENFSKVQYLIPIDGSDITQMNIEIKFVSEIPGVWDKRQSVWAILHSKTIKLNAERFLKTCNSNKHSNLKKPKETIEELIQQTTEHQHGHLFKISNVPDNKTENVISFYVKLPENFKESLKNESYFKQFSPQKASILQKQLTSDEFLKSKSNLTFMVATEKVSLQILNDDFCKPLLKVFCDDIRIAFDIRNFFATLFYKNFEDYQPGMEFVSNAMYTSTENLRKKLKKCLIKAEEEIPALTEEYLRNIVGALPI